VPVPSQDKFGRVAAERAFGVKMGGVMEAGAPIVRTEN